MTLKPKLLVSACLLGRPVRYDGSAMLHRHELLNNWRRDGRVIGLCPELLGGFPTPRPPAEIVGTGGGWAVLNRQARVLEFNGEDVTASIIDGAVAALAVAVSQGCRFSLLTDGSPSCGSTYGYSGSFNSQTQPGEGVTAALLRQHGISVFTTEHLGDLATAMGS